MNRTRFNLSFFTIMWWESRLFFLNVTLSPRPCRESLDRFCWCSTHQESTSTGVTQSYGEAEPEHWWSDWHVQSTLAVWVIHNLVQDQESLIVSGIDGGADEDGQVHGRGPADHRDVGVLWGMQGSTLTYPDRDGFTCCLCVWHVLKHNLIQLGFKE